MDFTQTLSCKNKPGTISFWELEFHLWEKFDDRKIFLGEAFSQLTKKEKEQALHTNANIMLDVSKRLGFSALTVPGGYWELAPGKSSYYWLPDEYRYKQAEILAAMVGNELELIVNTGGILAMPSSNDFIDFSIKMFDNPENIDKLAENTLEESKLLINKYRELGFRVFLTASDIADNSGPYFPPEQFNRFILPYIHKWSGYIKNLDCFSILHTDGNIGLYLDAIADTPLNAIQAIDPVAGMDIIKTKTLAGNRLCLCGNLDCRIVTSENPQNVYKAVKKLLSSMKSYNGFAFGMSNVLERDTPKENYEALINALREMEKEQI